jgi:simple sugar transport system ATP-binding protein
MSPPLLEIQGLSKSFGRTDALRNVDLVIQPGEIHGLVGLNGSGKSTLLNILSGHPMIAATGGFKGLIRLAGMDFRPANPRTAMNQGVGILHQEPLLLPELSVAKNITLGRETVGKGLSKGLGRDLSLVDTAADEMRAKTLLENMGIEAPVTVPVSGISFSNRPFISLAREMDRRHLSLFLLDEPTAALGSEDIPKLFQAIRQLSGRGTAIVFVSHRLSEVFSICDRLTVLREGKVVERMEREAFDTELVCTLMTSRKPIPSEAQRQAVGKEPLLSIQGLSAQIAGEHLRGLTLEVRKGEILGLAGLAGHGKLAVAPAILGLIQAAGRISWEGLAQVPIQQAGALFGNEVAYVPEDRRQQGLLLDHSVMENIVFSAMQQKGRFLKPFPILPLRLASGHRMRQVAGAAVEKLGIRCASLKQKVGELSGGNQQKVCLARAFTLEPRLLFISEPTRGIDVAARELVLDQLLSAHAGGMTLILASSELDDLKRVCHRIALIHEGRLAALLPPDADETDFARIMCNGIAGTVQ